MPRVQPTADRLRRSLRVPTTGETCRICGLRPVLCVGGTTCDVCARPQQGATPHKPQPWGIHLGATEDSAAWLARILGQRRRSQRLARKEVERA